MRAARNDIRRRLQRDRLTAYEHSRAYDGRLALSAVCTKRYCSLV